jgi:nifR3 family TIM-barrel protein
MNTSKPAFMVKDLPIQGDLILAPMDGYTDWPFRSICRELGSAISYTEFVKAEDVLQRPHYIKDKIHFTETERPVFIQVYSSDPRALLAAARDLQEKKPDAIDINMGCPNRSIAGRGAGAGLMRTPIKAARIIKNLSRELDIPITAKIRLGWQDCWNGLQLAKIIELCGGSLVAVHARSKEQGHQGAPDLEALAGINSAIDIPVLGNGGIRTVDDIQTMLELTKCAGVMIGRGAIANPWLFSRKERSEIKPSQVLDLFHEHLDRSLSFYGIPEGLVLFRKFAAAYLEPYQLDKETRRKLLTEVDPIQFREQTGEIFDSIQ